MHVQHCTPILAKRSRRKSLVEQLPVARRIVAELAAVIDSQLESGGVPGPRLFLELATARDTLAAVYGALAPLYRRDSVTQLAMLDARAALTAQAEDAVTTHAGSVV